MAQTTSQTSDTPFLDMNRIDPVHRVASSIQELRSESEEDSHSANSPRSALESLPSFKNPASVYDREYIFPRAYSNYNHPHRNEFHSVANSTTEIRDTEEGWHSDDSSDRFSDGKPESLIADSAPQIFGRSFDRVLSEGEDTHDGGIDSTSDSDCKRAAKIAAAQERIQTIIDMMKKDLARDGGAYVTSYFERAGELAAAKERIQISIDARKKDLARDSGIDITLDSESKRAARIAAARERLQEIIDTMKKELTRQASNALDTKGRRRIFPADRWDEASFATQYYSVTANRTVNAPIKQLATNLLQDIQNADVITRQQILEDHLTKILDAANRIRDVDESTYYADDKINGNRTDNITMDNSKTNETLIWNNNPFGDLHSEAQDSFEYSILERKESSMNSVAEKKLDSFDDTVVEQKEEIENGLLQNRSSLLSIFKRWRDGERGRG